MDLWQMVLTDHANIVELCREVLRATGGGPNGRAGLFEELDVELERHFRAEEKAIHPALARDDRTRSYLRELGQERQEIRRRMDELSARPDVNSRDWAQDFKQLAGMISHAFTLEEGGVMTLARTIIEPHELDTMRLAYEREKIASIEARRWHMPQAMMPSRYGASTGMVFGVLAGVAAVGTAALLWSQTRQRSSSSNRRLQPVRRQPEPPFPLQSGVIDNRLSRGGGIGRPAGGAAAGSTMARQGFASGDEAGPPGTPATNRAGGDPAQDTSWFSSANPPRAPSGLSTGLQPGGLAPGGGPAASTGSIGTGGAQTGGQDTGSLKRDGR
jgi:Hemerythrin HHE cation binding domain